MKGRTPPPPSAQQARVQALIDHLIGQPGCYVLEIRHDDGCPTIVSQDERQCTCKEVEQQIIPIGGAK